MIPEIGNFAVILALLLATAQAVLPLLGAARGDRTLMSVARPAARGQTLFVTLAFACFDPTFFASYLISIAVFGLFISRRVD